MPSIEVSRTVWRKLQQLAVPLVDTPDTVLKRVLGIELDSGTLDTSNSTSIVTTPPLRKVNQEGIGELEFRTACLQLASSIFPDGYKKIGRVISESPDRTIGAVTLVSKAHDLIGSTQYWYGFQENHSDTLSSYSGGFLILGCGSPETTLAIPFQDVMEWVDDMNRTERQDSFYWHIHIYEDGAHLVLHLQEGVPRVNLDKYRIPAINVHHP